MLSIFAMYHKVINYKEMFNGVGQIVKLIWKFPVPILALLWTQKLFIWPNPVPNILLGNKELPDLPHNLTVDLGSHLNNHLEISLNMLHIPFTACLAYICFESSWVVWTNYKDFMIVTYDSENLV